MPKEKITYQYTNNFYNVEGCESINCQNQKHCGVPDVGLDQSNLKYYCENFGCPNIKKVVEGED